MSTVKSVVGTRSAVTVTGLSTLASATYIQSDAAVNCNTNQPLDVVVEVSVATTNAPASLKQVQVFIRESMDGTNYRSGPTSGTTATREANLRNIGTVAVTTTATTEVGLFSVAAALGYVPYDFYIVLKNETGVALTSGSVAKTEISGTVS